jgi:Lar family restriction alleviation protein
MIVILCCPFCGGVQTYTEEHNTDYSLTGHPVWNVICAGCNCTGPEAFTEQEAMRLWNSRK